MNLSCRLAEFPRTAGGGNSDGRQERRKGLVLGCTTTPRVLHSHGMKTGNGVVGTGQAVVGEKGNALASRCAHQGIIVWGSTLVSAAVRAWVARERKRCRRWRRREGGEVRACSGFHGGASLLLRQNDQQHVLQDALVLSDDHDHPPVSSPSFHHVSSRQVFSHAAAPSDSRAMRCASVRVTW